MSVLAILALLGWWLAAWGWFAKFCQEDQARELRRERDAIWQLYRHENNRKKAA